MVLGQGTYGCVYRPPLKCSNSTGVHPPNSVGKIFNDDKDFEKEENLYKLVANVNSKHEFTVPRVGSCAVSKNSIDESCYVVDGERDSYKQIIYQFGGISLQNIIENESGTTKRFLEIWRALRPLLVGISKLSKRGWMHGDIKLDNILLDGRRLNLIDFGMMTRPEDLFQIDNFWILIGDNPFTPPEYRLFLESIPVTDIPAEHKWFAYPAFNHGKPRNMGNFVDQGISHKSNGFIPAKGGNLNILDILIDDFGVKKTEITRDLQLSYRKGFDKIFEISKMSVFELGLVLAVVFVWAGKLEDDDLSDEYMILINNMTKFGESRYNIEKVLEHYDMISKFKVNANNSKKNSTNLSNDLKSRAKVSS